MRVGRGAHEPGNFALFLFLCVPSAASDALMMTFHTVNTMARLGEHKLIDAIVTRTTFEAMRVVGVIASHNCFVENRLVTDAATV